MSVVRDLVRLGLLKIVYQGIKGLAYLGKKYERVASKEELIRAVEEVWKAIPNGRFMDLCGERLLKEKGTKLIIDL
ncbi:hypothetical protein L873DRAFT_1823559 [Choiromyces venosus 120613-1]|uniref:Uncharacterized protein n=1 Tax=Choiromyces venosus 120613-1 TaxID=1336337 RepID=A0A3N4ITB7_9PEZI|nr:hypothetical protein L873DRAFT_1823559 [Choiromyces venosus 120613-1]